MASGSNNVEQVEEDQRHWISIFQQCYNMDSVTLQDVKELKAPFVLKIYMHFVKITLNASLDNMKLVRNENTINLLN